MAKADIRIRYPGVQPFRTDQQGIFFGRDEDTQRLFSTVSGERLTVLHGKSGYGKSSIIQAGLLPRMATENDRGRRLYLPLVIRFNAWQKGADLFDKYRFQEAAALRDWGIAATKSKLPTTLPGTLWGNWKRQNLPDNAHLVLIFDQFEEFFTYPTEQQADFKEQLAELLYTDYPQYLEENEDDLEEETLNFLSRRIDVRALFSIRSDRLSELDRLQDRLPAILHKRLQLGPLSPTQAQAAIVQPALLGATATDGHDFASPPFEYRPDTLAHLLKTLQNSQPGAGVGVEAFLLQVFCNAIEARVIAGEIPDRDGNGLSDVEVSDLPATNQVMEDYYARQIGAVATDLQPVARRMLEDQLVQVEADGTGRRMSVDGRALLQTFGAEGVDQPLLDQLVENYLLRREPNSTGGLSYELSHDTLLAPALASRKDREERLAAALREEQKLAAEAKLREQEAVLHAEQKKRRRERIFGILMAGLAVLAVGAFVWALGQHREARTAQGKAERQTVIADSLLLVAKDNIAEAERQRGIAEEEKANAVTAKDKADQQRLIAIGQTRLANSARNEAEERAARAAALNEALAEDDSFQYLLDRGNDFFGEGDWRDAVTYWGAARFLAEQGSAEEALAGKYLGLAQTGARAEEQVLAGEIEKSLVDYRGFVNLSDRFLKVQGAKILITQLESTLENWETEIDGREIRDIDSIFLSPFSNELGIIGIPRAITKLDSLIFLEIINNDYLSTMPSWTGLEQLQQLNIRDNKNLNTIPSWTGLENLQQLNIKSNHNLTNIMAWTGLRELQQLNITDNGNLRILPTWTGLEQLQMLNIENNYSLRNLPAWTGLEQLQQLNITQNKSLKTLPDWTGLENLQQLSISYTNLKNLPGWTRLEQLQTLNIYDNDSLSTLPDWTGLEQLQQLSISNNDSLKILPDWTRLEQLLTLNIDYNNRLSTLPDWTGLEQLQQLSISGGYDLKSLPDWTGLENLQQLSISGGYDLKSLPDWTGLENLQQLEISASIKTLPDWTGLESLQQLEISGSIKTLPDWTGLESLQQLSISRSEIDTLSAWTGMENLQQLSISGSIKTLPAWTGLEQLQQLSISGSYVLKSLPDWTGLENLQQLEILSNDNLEALPAWEGSINIDTLIIMDNPGVDSLPNSTLNTTKIHVLYFAENGDEDEIITLNNWLGFAECKEIHFSRQLFEGIPYLRATSPNIHTLPKTFINLAPTLKILNLRGTRIPPEEVDYWRKVLPDTDIWY